MDLSRSVGIHASLFVRSEGNKANPLKVGSNLLSVYCHMTDDLGACGGGGWTLVMKIDGRKVKSMILIVCIVNLERLTC